MIGTGTEAVRAVKVAQKWHTNAVEDIKKGKETDGELHLRRATRLNGSTDSASRLDDSPNGLSQTIPELE